MADLARSVYDKRHGGVLVRRQSLARFRTGHEPWTKPDHRWVLRRGRRGFRRWIEVRSTAFNIRDRSLTHRRIPGPATPSWIMGDTYVSF